MPKLRNQSRLQLSVLLLFAVAAALVIAAPASRTDNEAKTAGSEWPTHGGNPAHTQYSPLAQINTMNVSRLKVAWVYHTGDHREDNRSQIQCNPIIVDGVLYATSPQIKVFALDAATGKERWTFDPFK